jgi:hypothetical protein
MRMELPSNKQEIFKKSKHIYYATVLGYRSGGLGSIPGTTRFSEK